MLAMVVSGNNAQKRKTALANSGKKDYHSEPRKQPWACEMNFFGGRTPD